VIILDFLQGNQDNGDKVMDHRPCIL
jgi:hypothetical protein